MLLPCPEQGLAVPGGKTRQHRPRQILRQVPEGGQGLEHIDPVHRQEEPRPRQGPEQRSVQQPESLEGRGGGEDQDRGGQEGQRLRKLQEQQRPHAGSQQGGDTLGPRAAGRRAPQGKGGAAPGIRLAVSAAVRKKRIPRDASRTGRRSSICFLCPTACPSCISPPVAAASSVFSTILQPPGRESRREKRAARRLSPDPVGGGLFTGNVVQ